MNKRIKPLFIAATIAEAITALLEILIFISSPPDRAFDHVNSFAITLFAGVWLPILAGFIGICAETRFKRLKAMPITVGIPLVFCAAGIIYDELNPPSGWAFSGLSRIPREIFCVICGGVSLLILIGAIIHIILIKRKHYAEFLAMPDKLFTGRSFLWLIPLAVLTAVCLIPAINGYSETFHV